MPKFVNFFYLFSLTAGIIGLASAGDNTGAANQYVVTLTKMELCTDAPLTSEEDVTCVGAVTLGNETMEFDIASVAVGATVGAYSDANGLPIGTTYRYAKPTFLRKMQLTGSVELSDPTCTCRTNASSTFNAAVGAYKSVQAGVCNDGATPESQTIYMLDHVTDNSNRVCTNASCSTFFNTNWEQTSIAAQGNRLYGRALSKSIAGELTKSGIYELESPYTVRSMAPNIEIAFGTANAVYASSFSDGTQKCYVDNFFPKVRISITDPTSSSPSPPAGS